MPYIQNARVPGVELLAERIEFHRGVVGRDDALLHAALEPAEGRRELVALEQQIAASPGSTKLLP